MLAVFTRHAPLVAIRMDAALIEKTRPVRFTLDENDDNAVRDTPFGGVEGGSRGASPLSKGFLGTLIIVRDP